MEFVPFALLAAWCAADRICSKRFPRDLGKERPCLNYHMNNCDAWCQLSRSPEEYRTRMQQAVLMLQGGYAQVEQ